MTVFECKEFELRPSSSNAPRLEATFSRTRRERFYTVVDAKMSNGDTWFTEKAAGAARCQIGLNDDGVIAYGFYSRTSIS
jgi:hypothetical protein